MSNAIFFYYGTVQRAMFAIGDVVQKSLLCRSNYVMLTHILFHVLFAVVSTLEQTERDQVPLPMDNGPPFSLTEAHKFVSE
jgi:hypothetical protein